MRLKLPAASLQTLLASLALLATSVQAINSTDLANALLPASSSAADGQLITGESKEFGPLTLAVLSNATHALGEYLIRITRTDYAVVC